jgi:tetratricopeptide (TPR) repeat protein
VKTILAIFLTVLLLLPVSALGEIQTVTHTVKQPFGGSQSPDDARLSAIAKAKREALELVGTYVEALTVVKEAKVDKDEILALTAGVVTAEVVSQKNYHTDDAFGIEIVVKVDVERSFLAERVKKLLQDRPHLEQLNQARKKEQELLVQVAKLEAENQRHMAEKGNTKDLKVQFKKVSEGLYAVDWRNKALSLWDGEKFTDAEKAIKYLNEAIRLDPDDAHSYTALGLAYSDLDLYIRAIQDFNEAIRLQPSLAIAYSNRGVANRKLGQHQAAIQDFNEAIRLKPHDASYYNNRGNSYASLEQYPRAIQDYNEAIRIEPGLTKAYKNRGAMYSILEQYQRAIQDYTETIRLKSDYADAYISRGMAYFFLKQYPRAIQDFDEAIRLLPNDAYAHSRRGFAFVRFGNFGEGCRSLAKGCELGECDTYNSYRKIGTCR